MGGPSFRDLYLAISRRHSSEQSGMVSYVAPVESPEIGNIVGLSVRQLANRASGSCQE